MKGHAPPLTAAAPPRDGVRQRAVAVLASVGDDFLPAVVDELGQSLGAELALVGEILPDGRIQSMAVSRHGARAENFVYEPRRLPSGRGPAEVLVSRAGDDRHPWPPAPHLPRDCPCAGIVLGAPGGDPIGIMLVTLSGPDADEHAATPLLTLFAARVAGELQRARTERELRRHDEHLFQIQRVDAIGRLAGGVAHDFNNLLMIVIGYAELLKERHGESPETNELIAAATRATTLTRQLLAFGRRQVLHAQRIDLNRVVAQVQTMLAPVIGAHVSIVVDLAGALPPVEADPGQIEQVLVNLALNARDAMPGGGQIRFDTRLEQVHQDYHQMPHGSYVCLAISDTGTGMSAEVQRHIFEPFYTTKGTRGTGLGLSSVYGIIKQSGGYIWCSSAVGAGTTFRIYLKPATVPADASAAPEPRIEGTSVGVERVLVVDDEPGVRRLLARVLTARGYTVADAADAHEALTHLAHAVPPFDLVVSDMVMPGMDGLALAAAVAARWPQTKILLMSGYAQGMRQGGAIPPHIPFLPRPFTAQQLAAMVRGVIENR